MRELDLLLEKFLSTDFDGLDDDELKALGLLLDEPDQDILAWLCGSREAPRRHESIVSRVRSSLG